MRSNDGVACSTNAVNAASRSALPVRSITPPRDRRHTLHYAGMPAKGCLAAAASLPATTLAAWRSTCTPTRRRATAPRRPSVVVERAVEAGLTTVALTDHDTTLGWARGERRGARARHPAGAGHRGVVQPAGQEHPPAGLPARPRRRRPGRGAGAGARQPRHQARPDGRPDGGGRHPGDAWSRCAPRWRTVPRRAARTSPTRWSTAGVVDHRDEAFARWLGNDSPYYVSHYAPDPVRAIGLVRAAGGVPVIAHPWSGTRGRVVGDALVEELAAAGLAGLEVAPPRPHPGGRAPPRARSPARSTCWSPGRATTTARAS